MTLSFYRFFAYIFFNFLPSLRFLKLKFFSFWWIIVQWWVADTTLFAAVVRATLSDIWFIIESICVDFLSGLFSQSFNLHFLMFKLLDVFFIIFVYSILDLTNNAFNLVFLLKLLEDVWEISFIIYYLFLREHLVKILTRFYFFCQHV